MREERRIKTVLFHCETFHLHPTKAFNVSHVRAIYWLYTIYSDSCTINNKWLFL